MAATCLFHVVLLSFIITSAVCICPNGWTKYDHVCYALFEENIIWRDASTLCREFGGHLATLNTTAKIQNVKAFLKYVNHGRDVWIGGTDLGNDGMWVWDVDQSPITHTDWNPGQPDNPSKEKCIRLNARAGYKWFDSNCSDKREYICERRST